jgi:tellurite resistance protein TerC
LAEIQKKGTHDHELLNALKWVGMWIAIAMCVMALIWKFMGRQLATEFLGGYVIEFSLSMDNLFVFMSIFTSFGISEHAQHRVLHWGIIGAIIMRFIFIMAGVAIVERFAWVLYIFGVLLLYNGIKMFKGDDKEEDPTQSPIMKFIRKFLPMTEDFRGEKFFVKEYSEEKGKIVHHATPLFGVLLLIEFSDIIFAIDSVPAVFSISIHPLVVYSSNILAILGLRQLYFVLEYMAKRFQYVRYGVAIILMFTGFKLLAEIFHIEVGTEVSILVIIGILAASIILSMVISGRKKDDEDGQIAENAGNAAAELTAEKAGNLNEAGAELTAEKAENLNEAGTEPAVNAAETLKETEAASVEDKAENMNGAETASAADKAENPKKAESAQAEDKAENHKEEGPASAADTAETLNAEAAQADKGE